MMNYWRKIKGNERAIQSMIFRIFHVSSPAIAVVRTEIIEDGLGDFDGLSWIEGTDLVTCDRVRVL